jgi:hypothetical protein
MNRLEGKRRFALKINYALFAIAFIVIASLGWAFHTDYLLEQEFVLGYLITLVLVVSVVFVLALITGEAWTGGLVFRIEESAIGYYLALLTYFSVIVASIVGVFKHW